MRKIDIYNDQFDVTDEMCDFIKNDIDSKYSKILSVGDIYLFEFDNQELRNNLKIN